ncbi:hypothetical protein LF1_11530 [Rubripirellula obstinata]|uniref:HNH nuclease domain-containing protein n=1 Tax=Rubripirellula obstinata TaxID=406547 RepID=A0A5B1CEI7_9BACT|nr:HNH endonuclease [Rubripirellula obstinata]KAA1258631.1 hypothetical protein LF1_11530 [Rubripirellula obstinata]
MTDGTKYGSKWEREETILAFDLYCRIPFRATKRTNPAVVQLAELIGRTPSSVARKLGNFGSFDPKLKARGVVGLSHASSLDREVFHAFQDDWESLIIEAEEIKRRLQDQAPILDTTIASGSVPSPRQTETLVVRKQRIGQDFFRAAVVASYDFKCCVTGLDVPECLIASHIVPWNEDESARLDPANGLCLSATFDKLFDRFLMTVEPDYTMRFSSRLEKFASHEIRDYIDRHAGSKIVEPDKFTPREAYLSYHNDRFSELENLQ